MVLRASAAWAILALLIVSVAGCNAPDASTGAAPAAASTEAESTCPDDGPRLPGMGLCKGRAGNYLNIDAAARTPELEGCSWSTEEALLGDTGDGFLYQAATCKGVTTQLELSAGAHSGSIQIVRSALSGDTEAGREVVRLFPLEGVADPRAMLLEMARGTTGNAEEAAACEVVDAQREGWGSGILLIDVNDAYKTKMGIKEEDGSRTACGPYGIDTGSVRYWQVKQGYAWLYDLGQDQPAFDPTSITLMRRESGGSWTPQQ
jgi:hypothetical protein